MSEELSSHRHKLTYSSFTLDMIRKHFGVTIGVHPIFTDIAPPVAPPEMLTMLLEKTLPLPLISEKARSEFIVAPVLLAWRELVQQHINIYSGIRFDVAPEEGLQGTCDFIVSKTPPLPTLQAPLLVILEAKKNDIDLGLGQCASEMIAAQRFNQKEGIENRPIYGCVTTGELWQFLRLDDHFLSIDPERIYIKELERLLGLLVHIAL